MMPLLIVRAAAVVPDVIEAGHERGDPEDAGPRELGLGHPDARLGRGHDQRPGVGEPQGGRQVDREAEVGRLQRRRLELQRGIHAGRHRIDRLVRVDRPDDQGPPRRGSRRLAPGCRVDGRRRRGRRLLARHLADDHRRRSREPYARVEGAGCLGEAVGTRGGGFAVGIGEAAVRGQGEPSFIADGEADGFGKAEGRVAVAARAFTRRGELSFVTGTARDLPGRAGSFVAVASGTAAAWSRGPEFGVDVG